MKNKKIIEDAMAENERIGKLHDKEKEEKIALKKENSELRKEFIRDFIKQFPKDTESWGLATDELPELHKWMADRYNEEAPEKPYRFDFENRSWTPAIRNTRHREGIEKLLELMDDKQIGEVNERFRNWFWRSIVSDPADSHKTRAEMNAASMKVSVWYDSASEEEIDRVVEGLGYKPYKFKVDGKYPLWEDLGKGYSEKFGQELRGDLESWANKNVVSEGLDGEKFDDKNLEENFQEGNKERKEEGKEPLTREKFLERKKRYAEAKAKKEELEKPKMLVYHKQRIVGRLIGSKQTDNWDEINVMSDDAKKIKKLLNDGYVLKDDPLTGDTAIHQEKTEEPTLLDHIYGRAGKKTSEKIALVLDVYKQLPTLDSDHDRRAFIRQNAKRFPSDLKAKIDNLNNLDEMVSEIGKWISKNKS